MDISGETSAVSATTILDSEKYHLSSTDIAGRGMIVNDSYQNSGIPPPPYARDDNESCRIDMRQSRNSASQRQEEISRTRAVKSTCFFCGFLISGTFLIATAAVMLSGGDTIDPVSHKKQSSNYKTIGPIFLGLGFSLFIIGTILICRACKTVYFEGSDGRDPIISERQCISRRSRNPDAGELHGHDNAAYEFSIPHRHMDIPDLGLFVYPPENSGNSRVPRLYQRPPGYWEEIPPPAYSEPAVLVPTHGIS